MYALVFSVGGLVCVINLLRGEAESLQQLHEKAVVFAKIESGLLLTIGEEGRIAYHSFRMQSG